MKKILIIFSKIVIFFFILSLFGWIVYQISGKNKKFGFITEPVKFIYSFPDLFPQSVKEVKTLPKTFVPTPKKFQPINKLKKDLIVLVVYSESSSSRAAVIMNLKNDSIIKKSTIENPYEDHTWIKHPMLHPDGSLVYYHHGKPIPSLHKIDSTGNLIWKQDKVTFHHAINLNKDGDIWACKKNTHGRQPADIIKIKKDLVTLGRFFSNMVSYDFEANSFSIIGDSLIIRNKVYTYTEGLMEFIDSSTFFVEEQNSGLL